MLGKLTNIFRKKNGQALVLIAVMLPVLIGMIGLVTDVGFMFLTKSQLQTAADQGALAGCYDLSGANPSVSKAKIDGENYAHLKPGKAADNVLATVTYVVGGTQSVKVDTSRTINLFFAPLFGLNSSTITATATAQVFAASSIPPGAPPFVIEAPKNIVWQGGPNGDSYSQRFYMKKTPNQSNPLEFTYVDNVFKKPTSFNDYLKLLSDGYSKEVDLNTILYHIAPATAGKSSVDAFAKRLTTDPNTDPVLAKVGDDRLMLIPIVEKLPTTQETWTYQTQGMNIKGFVGFWFESINKGKLYNGNYYYDFVVTGRFVRVALPPGSGAVVPGQQWYGTGSIRLVK